MGNKISKGKYSKFKTRGLNPSGKGFLDCSSPILSTHFSSLYQNHPALLLSVMMERNSLSLGLVSSCHCNKSPQIQWFKQHKHKILRFCMSELRSKYQGVGGAEFPPEALGQNLLPCFSPCLAAALGGIWSLSPSSKPATQHLHTSL